MYFLVMDCVRVSEFTHKTIKNIAYIDPVRPNNHIPPNLLTTLQLHHPLLQINPHNLRRRHQRHRLPLSVFTSSNPPQLIMQRHPMDKLPGVFPALVHLGQIATVSKRVPLPGALNEPSHGIAAKFFGKDPPLSDDAAGVGAHGEGGAEFGEEAGLVVDLGGFVSC